MQVRHVDTGREGPVMIIRRWPPFVFRDGLPKAMIRDEIARLLVHELDECLYVDGARVTNPHPEAVSSAKFLGAIGREI